MDVNEFRTELIQDTISSSSVSGEGSSATFATIASNYLIEAGLIQDFVPCFYLGTGKNNRRIRVDGYSYNDIDSSLTLFIVDFSQDEVVTITRTDAIQQLDKLKYLLEEIIFGRMKNKIDIGNSAFDLVQLIKQYFKVITKFRLVLFTSNIMSNRIQTIEDGIIADIPIENQIWDIPRLMNVASTDSEIIEIDLRDYLPNGLPYIKASNMHTTQYQSYLCVLPGVVLAEIYDKYGSQLLEGNVRSFLSTKVAVNKDIRKTILSEPEMFFAYNNGISTVASSVEFSEDNSKINKITSFQIINGGQTTASLSRARFKDKASLEKISVQMKLTVLLENSERNQELIKTISRSSNSQNKVSEVDFFSSHPFHVRIEGFSRRIFAPAIDGNQYLTRWFYERARGQYNQEQMKLSKAEKDKYLIQNPKSQLVPKTDLAKVRNCWRGLPHFVSRGAQTNFVKFAELIDSDWIKNPDIFNEKYYRESISLLILFKHLESIIPKQPWYEMGYRANIAAYSLALFSEKLRHQYATFEFDLMMIWNIQKVPSEVSSELTKITKYVFESITSSDREVINVTQWCKLEKCWSRVKQVDYDIPTTLGKFLKSKQEITSEAKDAISDQKLETEVEILADALTKGSDFWVKLHNFTVAKRIGSPDFEEAIKVAKRIPLKQPNSYQCRKLYEFLEIAKAEGFIYE